MKVLFVCNNAFHPGNGQSVAVRKMIKALREHGVDARLMAIANADPDGPQPDFPLEHWKYPIFEPLLYNNGCAFAKIDKKIIKKAVEWADIVHIQEGMPLEGPVLRMAQKMNKAITSTYHIFAQNFTASLGCSKKSIWNLPLSYLWRRFVYDYTSDVQCPTPVVRDVLQKEGFKSRLHVISNGIDIPAEPVQANPVSPDGTIDLLCIGRLAKEKSQNTLLQAMRYSRYADRIRLNFAGNGPKAKYYKKMAEDLYKEGVLKTPANFGFYSHDQLRELARKCYLYIHCAWVEVEGLSCLEAVQQGTVPVIAQGDLIGTSVFALCPESLYPVYDSKALAERIDWWIEHPEKRNEMAQLYADSANKYDINKSAEALIEMFKQALDSKA